MEMDIRHKFEIAGLGTAPFRLVGFEVRKFQACPDAPILPGASCDFCGTGIMDCFLIKGSGPTDKPFKVGCDCVQKTGDRGLVDLVKREANRIKTEARHAREVERIRAARERLSDPAVCEKLASLPHPLAFTGVKTSDGPVRNEFFGYRTRLDWAEWMMANAGTSGRMEVARFLEKL